MSELKARVEDKILEQNNYELLKKLINKAEIIAEAQAISALGTTYKKTGFHFDIRLENPSNDIHFFAKDSKLSFENDKNKPTHTLIIGDNYPALLNLLIAYREKIKVIYIDPPYGKDNLGEFAHTNYDNAITRDNLLSMLKPRLELAKMLLRDDGVIFCSIDDRNQAYLKCLFDDIFGERNFVANIVWNSISSVLKQSKFIRKEHEYILCYAKNKNNLEFNRLENTMEFSSPDNDPKGEWFSSNAAHPNQNSDTNKFAIQLPNGTECVRNWKFSYEDFISGKVSLYFKNGNVPRLKIYKSEYDVNTKILASIFKDLGSITTAKTEMKSIFSDFADDLFDTPKPVNLIKRLLEISTTPNNPDFNGGGGGGHPPRFQNFRRV
ncbi:site-specific DNA-methyltransferase [Helicobacter sp. T3_23-1059]